MIRLYLTPVPERTGDDATDQIGSQVQQAGLLDTGGTSVTNVATESVDFAKRGRIQIGPTLTRKVADELDSLSKSGYTTLPLFDAADGSLGRKRGYYEVARIDVSPAQESRDDVYTYDVQLTLAGTREDSRRAVRTNPQAIDSVYSDASTPALVAIPDAATDVRWYDEASGTEAASAAETAEAEFGTVARYDPANASSDSPTLTYDLAFESDGPTDVRVYDSRDRVKMAATVSGDEANVWTHVFHKGRQFNGAAVIDTGRFRLALGGDLQTVTERNGGPRTVASGETFTVADGELVIDESLTVEDSGTFTVESDGTYIDADGELRDDVAATEWNENLQAWVPVTIDADNSWSLAAWSLTRVRPARTRLRTTWSDGTDEATLDATFERGADRVVWTTPENASAPPQGLLDLLQFTARDTDTAAFATQGLIDRSTRDE